MAEITITSEETLSDNKFSLKNFTYTKPDSEGQKQEHKAEIYFRPDAATVLLYDNERETFLLTKQFRIASFLNGNSTGYLTEACAGLIDDGESPEETAKREVREELGYEIDNLVKAGAVYTSAGGITEYVHLFLAPYTNKQKTSAGGGLPEEGEEIDALEVPFSVARQMLKDGKINDAKTVMLLQYYFLFC
jgi:GDP-mannose pyrophosphatase NudK